MCYIEGTRCSGTIASLASGRHSVLRLMLLPVLHAGKCPMALRRISSGRVAVGCGIALGLVWQAGMDVPVQYDCRLRRLERLQDLQMARALLGI